MESCDYKVCGRDSSSAATDMAATPCRGCRPFSAENEQTGSFSRCSEPRELTSCRLRKDSMKFPPPAVIESFPRGPLVPNQRLCRFFRLFPLPSGICRLLPEISGFFRLFPPISKQV